MIDLNEDALICDLAETYQIYDYRSLPVKLVATLSAGLRENSRIRMQAAEAPVSFETMILATIADNLTMLRAGFDKNGRSRKLFLFTEAIQGETKPKVTGFRTVTEFEAALQRIRRE